MKKLLSPVLLTAVMLAAAVMPLHAQLTADQKAFEMQVLASLYAKQYAPYEWKRDVMKFDLLDLGPWVAKARAAKDDLDFYQVMAEYVGSLNDAHDTYFNQSDFTAELPFNVDIYDGKVLIDVVIRSLLPLKDYPFDIGDELISIDGKSVADIITDLSKIDSYANPLSTRRWAADKLTFRWQGQLPRASELGDTADVLIKLKSGETAAYKIKWIKSGTPVKKIGPVPGPRLARSARDAKTASKTTTPLEQALAEQPSYMRMSLRMQYLMARPKRLVPHTDEDATGASPIPDSNPATGNDQLPQTGEIKAAVNGNDSLVPVFSLPTGFTRRLGAGRNDYFYSGTFAAQGKRIGYIRIADFQPLPFSLLSLAIRQFNTEMTFMNANTDGLVVDVMRNPGGFGCYSESLFQNITTKPFRTIAEELRPTLTDVISIEQQYSDAVSFGATQNELAWLGGIKRDIESAYSENRGRTGPLPICDLTLDIQPAANSAGAPTGYAKPAILLVDEFTTSAGDVFAALFQDNKRGPLVGMRTAGAGGSVLQGISAGFYSEGSTSITAGMLVRPSTVNVAGFPATNYIENVGVQPDIKVDYMTQSNLTGKGADFVQAFTNAMVEEINRPK